MNVTSCEKKENSKAELTVVVSPEEFDAALTEAYKKSKNQISVPGFRKGKAPRKIIERMYGESVFYNDALDTILPGVCSTGIAENELRTVGYPSIDDVSFGDDKSATVTYTVELYPEVTVGEYKGVSAVRPDVVVEDAEIDSEIAGVQTRNARIQTATRPAVNGDTVVMDFEGFVDGVAFEGGKGESYELTLGSNTFIPGFEEKLQGMSAGEERDLDLQFPDNYKEDLAGKPVVFKVKVIEVKEKLMPELDDEFAKDVSEFDTMDEYRASIREKLTESKKSEADKAFEDAVLSKVAETIEQDIPDAMVEEFVDNQMESMRRQLSSYGMDLPMYLQMMGADEKSFRDTMRPNALVQVKITLALEKIAELEKIEPTDEEIDQYYSELAERYNVELDVAKTSVPKASAEQDLKLRAASKLVLDAAVAEAPEAPAEEKKPAKKKTTTKKAAADDDKEAAADDAKKPAAKKPAAKKPAAKKPAAKKPADEKTADDKPAAEKKPAAKKPAAKKPAAKKTTAKESEKATDDKSE